MSLAVDNPILNRAEGIPDLSEKTKEILRLKHVPKKRENVKIRKT